MTLKLIEYAIFELLKNKAGGRVTYLRAPQNQTAPFIVLTNTSSNRNFRSINSAPSIAQATIQVDVYAEEFYECKNIAADIESTLDAYRGTVYHGNDSPQEFVRIAGISLVSTNDLLDQTEEPFLYRQSTDFLVTYEQ